jgi:hypothetical protein
MHWQIELVLKRLKSIGQLARCPNIMTASPGLGFVYSLPSADRRTAD